MKRNYNQYRDAYFRQISANIRNWKYQYMGNGSGRTVYDLGGGRVVKSAKNMKGIAQNIVECEISAMDHSGLFAEVLNVSDDYRLLIMEKADRIRNISYIWAYFQVNNNEEFYQVKKIRNAAEKYNLLIQDLGRAANWGHIDGIPVIVDYGFTRQVRKRYYRAASIGPKRKSTEQRYRLRPN